MIVYQYVTELKTMKKLLILWLVAALGWGCSTQQQLPRVPDENLIFYEDPGDEYELIIIDPGYSTWFATNSKPVGFYSKSYYEAKNQLYASAWNDLFYRYGSNSPFENQINYDPTIDYGLELNYQLFWYFKYIERQYGRFYNFPS